VAMAMAAGGLDALAFTAGVGENSASVRASICDRLAFLGIELDKGANEGARGDVDIAASGSRARVHVVHAREELVLARAARTLVAPSE
jgi:acetate kinase